MKEIQVYMKVVEEQRKEKIKCMCIASNKLCDRDCELETVEYDQYKGWEMFTEQDRWGR